MGTGKSTMGAGVASQLNVPFLDTDLMIEDQTGMTINQIFSSKGENEFRQLEARLIRDTIRYEKALIATGGGLPIYNNNMQWLTEHGITMYLHWPEDILLASLVHQRSIRPLLSKLSEEEAMHKAMQLLEERKPIYEQASMTLEMNGELDNDVKLLEKACKYIW